MRVNRDRDRRQNGVERGEIPTILVVLGIVLVLSIGALGVVLISSSDEETPEARNAEIQPTNLWSVHHHGTIEVIIDGQEIDFSQERYQNQAGAFHFEGGEGSRWHVHAQNVTLEYAMGTLGFDITDSSVRYQGQTYQDGAPNGTVTITVNEEPVDPSTYVLRDGDQIRIVANRS